MVPPREAASRKATAHPATVASRDLIIRLTRVLPTTATTRAGNHPRASRTRHPCARQHRRSAPCTHRRTSRRLLLRCRPMTMPHRVTQAMSHPPMRRVRSPLLFARRRRLPKHSDHTLCGRPRHLQHRAPLRDLRTGTRSDPLSLRRLPSQAPQQSSRGCFNQVQDLLEAAGSPVVRIRHFPHRLFGRVVQEQLNLAPRRRRSHCQ